MRWFRLFCDAVAELLYRLAEEDSAVATFADHANIHPRGTAR